MALLLRESIKNCIKSPNKILWPNVRCNSTSPSSQSAEINKDVPGLSTNVVAVPTGEVGPGASKSSKYKNPEYFSYHNMSYFEAEIEMLKYRLPQPSSKSNSK